MLFSSPGMADTAASSSSLMSEQSLATHEVAEGLHVEVVCPSWGAPVLLRAESAARRPRHAASTEEQCPYGGFRLARRCNGRFEPLSILAPDTGDARASRWDGPAAVHRRAGSVQSWPLHQRPRLYSVSNACAVDLVAAITELIQHLFDGGGKLRLQLQERVGLGDGLTMVAHVLRSLAVLRRRADACQTTIHSPCAADAAAPATSHPRSVTRARIHGCTKLR